MWSPVVFIQFTQIAQIVKIIQGVLWVGPTYAGPSTGSTMLTTGRYACSGQAAANWSVRDFFMIFGALLLVIGKVVSLQGMKLEP